MAIFHVPDMSCGHCKASITATLNTNGADALIFDMEARTVSVTGIDTKTVITLLDQIGFPATVA